MRKLILFLVLVILSIQACFTANNPPEVEYPALLQLWKYTYEPVDAPNHPPLVTSNNLIVMSGDAHLTALSVKDGNPIWQKEDFGVYSLAGAELLENEEQLFTNHFDELIAWDRKTGDRIWTVPVDSPLTLFEIGIHAVFTNGYAIAGMGSQLYTVNTRGSVKYIKKLGMPVANVGSGSQRLFVGQAKTIHGALTLGRMTALDAQTGDSLWAYNTENGGFSRAAPIVEDGIVYAGAVGNSPIKEFVALDAETGEVIWRQTDWVRTDNFLVGPKYVYVNTGGTLAALDKVNGSIAWRFEWTSSAGLITPVYLEGYVYHSDHNRMFVLDGETGELVHEEPVPEGGSYFWHLAVSSDKLYAQTSRQLIAYQPWHLREE